MEWRLGVLVQGRVRALRLGELGRGGGIPGKAEAINVKEAVAGCDFMLRCQGMRQEFGQVVVVDLF